MHLVTVEYSEAGIGGRGLRSDDGLHKSTECLASLPSDSTLAPAALDRATSQPNLLAVGPQDLVSTSKDHHGTYDAPRSDYLFIQFAFCNLVFVIVNFDFNSVFISVVGYTIMKNTHGTPFSI